LGHCNPGDKMTAHSKNVYLLWFFILIFLFTIPFYYLVAQKGLAVGCLPALVPLPAALIIAFWQGKSSGLKNLLKKYSVRIPNYIWYVPTLILIPAIFLLADRLLGIFRDIPQPVILEERLPTFVVILICASTEEMAWMGYAFESMEDKWKTIGATIILAIIWIMWHIPNFYLLGQSATQILLFSIFMFGCRFIIVWIYKNTGKSSFTSSLVHATSNIMTFGVLLSVLNIGMVGTLGLLILAVVTIIITLIIIFLWGPGLNKFRWSR
jgi:membrane protease YdiL (CAAX protease family)